MADPTASTPDQIGDIEDWGAVEVTSKCCGAMTCRVLAPEIFLEARGGEPTKVFTVVEGRGLNSKEEYLQVRKAIPACPFYAIRFTRRPAPGLLPEGESLPGIYDDYPQEIEDGVHFLGHYSPETAAATTYFVKRSTGNFLVDAPKPTKALIDRIKALGGAKYLIFTHKDHTAFHKEWKEALGAARLLHAADVIDDNGSWFAVTADFEIKLSGDKTQFLDPDIKIIPIPGHTPGSVAILYKDKFLFTGDSLHYSRAEGHLLGSRLHCWSNWRQQTQSLYRLKDEKFLWVLPGHGEPHRFDTPEECQVSLTRCLQWMAEQPAGHTPLVRFVSWINLRKKKSDLWVWIADNVVLPLRAQRYIPMYRKRRLHPLLAPLFAAVLVLLAALLRRRRLASGRRVLGRLAR